MNIIITKLGHFILLSLIKSQFQICDYIALKVYLDYIITDANTFWQRFLTWKSSLHQYKSMSQATRAIHCVAVTWRGGVCTGEDKLVRAFICWGSWSFAFTQSLHTGEPAWRYSTSRIEMQHQSCGEVTCSRWKKENVCFTDWMAG